MKLNNIGFGLILLSVLLISCSDPQPNKKNNTVIDSEMADSSIIKTLQEAFRWGYPMMAMTLNNSLQYESTINAFYNMKKAADEKSQLDKGFNAETLYSAGALDLSTEPVVLSMPASLESNWIPTEGKRPLFYNTFKMPDLELVE